jgi:perosamine synthetase
VQIPFHKTHTTNEEKEAVINAIESGWLTMGPKCVEFEEKFKSFVDAKEAVMLNSATAALHLALKAIGLKEGDEVILPTNTFVATAEVVTYFNATPVLCDIEEDTHNIDVSKIEELITPKTKAIIPVHFAGQPCDMDEIYEIIREGEGRREKGEGKRENNNTSTFNLQPSSSKIYIIEDAAHALPSTYKGQIIGSLPQTDITCFSFYATKTLSTGEGGMATTNNPDFAKTIKINRLHGISRDAWDRYTSKGSWYYEVVDNGNKYNSTDINAALGLVQLKKQFKLRDKRAKIAKKYNEAFKDNKNITIPTIKDDRETSWHLYVIKVENRDEVIEKMKEKGIGCSVHFIPIHKHPYYKEKFGFIDSNYPIANKVFNMSISLPIYPDMSEDEVEYVIKSLKEIVK